MSQFFVESSAGPTPPGTVTELTGNTGGPVSPDSSNNINVVGATLYTVTGNPATHTLTINPLINAYPVTPYVVGIVGQAGYQTIQSAINAAGLAQVATGSEQSIWIQPGTYNENLILHAGVDLIGAGSVSQGPGNGVTINGVHTPPTSGHIILRNMYLASATDIMQSNAAGSTHIHIIDTESGVVNGYVFNLPNWTGTLEIENYNSLTGGVNDGGVNNNGGSQVLLYNCGFGAGSGKTMNVSGPFFTGETTVYCPINFQSGCNIGIEWTTFTNPLTCNGNSTGIFNFILIQSGSSPAFTMSSSAPIQIVNGALQSSNNPCIAGSGTGLFTLQDVAFIQNDNISNALTISTIGGLYPGGNMTTPGYVWTSNGPNTIPTFQPSTSTAFNYTNVNHAASPYTVLSTDYYISVDCSGGAVTLNFPNAPTFKRLWIIKDRTGNASANNISITTPGGTVTFDGLTTYVINSNYQAINLLANASPTYEVY